jgi:hypothetical protein
VTARPVTDVEELARRRRAAGDIDIIKRRYTLDRDTGVWRGWRAGRAELDEPIGDYRFVYADDEGFTSSQVLSHEFVSQYPRYLPDGEWPSTVEQWWLSEAFKLRESQRSVSASAE